jgi:preprotein translocase subunit YajC
MESMTWVVAQAGGGGFLETMMLLGVIFLIFWFILLRPQKKELDRHQAMIAALKAGDEVVTAGGLFGKVSAVDGSTVLLEIGKGTKIKVDRQKIQKTQEEFEREGKDRPQGRIGSSDKESDDLNDWSNSSNSNESNERKKKKKKKD